MLDCRKAKKVSVSSEKLPRSAGEKPECFSLSRDSLTSAFEDFNKQMGLARHNVLHVKQHKVL